MPITDMWFEGGFFFAKEMGRIDKDDAKAWAQRADELAAANAEPIAAVVDALEVTYVTAEARQIFVRASKIPNLAFAVVATRDVITTQTANIIGMMAQREHTYVFGSLEDAWDFARRNLNAARSG